MCCACACIETRPPVSAFCPRLVAGAGHGVHRRSADDPGNQDQPGQARQGHPGARPSGGDRESRVREPRSREPENSALWGGGIHQ